MLWASAFTVPGEHGKTPYMPLGINSMQAPMSAIPEEDDATPHVHLALNSIVDAYHYLIPVRMGNKT